MTYLKHNNGNGKRSKPAKKSEPQAPQINVDVDMSGVEAELANIARFVRAYVNNACTGENSLALFTGSEAGGYHPVRLVLEGDAAESIASALERIADALGGNEAKVNSCDPGGG